MHEKKERQEEVARPKARLGCWIWINPRPLCSGSATSSSPETGGLREDATCSTIAFMKIAGIREARQNLSALIEEVAKERRKRVSTGEMNRFLKTVDFDRASVPVSKRVRIYYMTQAAVAPPTFILFTDRPVKLHFSYQRFLENQIRAAFGFMGTPIWIKNRSR